MDGLERPYLTAAISPLEGYSNGAHSTASI
jgi:hypothetical protein